MSDTDIVTLSTLVERMKSDGALLETARLKLKSMEAAYRNLVEVDIPLQCESAGIAGITLPSGEVLSVVATVRASISKKNQCAAFTWLRDNGYGDIVKNVVSTSFGMGDDDKALAAFSALEDLHAMPEQRESVHASTLKAWVAERDRECDVIPDDLFGVFRGQKAVLK